MEAKISNNHVVVRAHPSDNKVLLAAGFCYDKKHKLWATPFSAIAGKIFGKSHPLVLKREEGEEDTYHKSMAVESDLEVPCNPGLTFRDYQKAGIEFMRDRSCTLLADEMGIGKTIQCIGLINLCKDIKSVLIVCPAGMKLPWKEELKKWLVDNHVIYVSGGKGAAYYSPLLGTERKIDITVINYEMLKPKRDLIRSIDWDLLILDEGHYIKNGKSQRAKEICGGRIPYKETYKILGPLKAKKKVVLTGTPIPNRPAELFTIAKLLCPYFFVSKYMFTKRYAEAAMVKGYWNDSGASNLDELQKILRHTIMVRRLKVDVLKDLPPKVRQIIEILPTDAEAIHTLRMETAMLESVVGKRSGALNEEDFKYLIKSMAPGRKGFGDHVATLRRKLGILKIPYMISHLEDSIVNSKKVVCFIHHKQVAAEIKEHFKNRSVTIVGGMNAEAKFAAVKAFQENPAIELCIGNLQAAGVGITLTASSHAVFCEPDWVPGVLSQCEDRLHRIGQTDSVLVQHLVFKSSLDSVMLKRAIGKQEIIAEALDIDPQIKEMLG